ncbi:hypothetical protein D9O50_16515 [Oxalobacteraceae bacterium CAVE-383]|nr:hypothetical protein D9O50_16515 [Oxalobacteraceae bacterium CAVE-383]
MMQQTKTISALCAIAAALFSPMLAHADEAAAAAAPAHKVVELPLVSGWFEGREVQYVTTDVSDPDAAVEMGANYVPRLANAIVPAAPGKPGAVERIYRVANFMQGSILPSIPDPVGAANRNRNYSPIWQVYVVTWAAGATPHELRAEEEVLDAEDKGQVTIAKSNIVVNCPVVFFAGAGLLPGAVIRNAPGAAQ